MRLVTIVRLVSALRGAALGAVVLTLAACPRDPGNASPVAEARLGVFFGSEVQELAEIPFELDRGKQTHGIRLVFRAPLAAPLAVHWEVDVPGAQVKLRDIDGRRGAGRLTRLGDATVPAGRSSFDQPIGFQPGDPLGVWNVRVLAGSELVIDKSFLVFDARARGQSVP